MTKEKRLKKEIKKSHEQLNNVFINWSVNISNILNTLNINMGRDWINTEQKIRLVMARMEIFLNQNTKELKKRQQAIGELLNEKED